MTNADEYPKKSGQERISNREINKGKLTTAIEELNGCEVGKRRSQIAAEEVPIPHGLGTAPVGDGIEKMHDAMAKLDQSDSQASQHGQDKA